MAETTWKTFKIEGTQLLAHLKELLRQGNLRRIVIEHGGKTVAEFPLTAGVVGLVAAPILAAVATLIALLKDCTIHVELATPVADPAGQTGDHAPVDAQC